ncbi:lambda family phage portal protein [Bradyrhizobium japonicum]|uniref:phage portal protein n=1 Tax=Bradyrhizobium TaxID=374 RepID=UPI001BA93E58|nr:MULTISPECIES: phage portal protein [Bradyrhizobium]MBR0880090.1 phage portal protein [Bradyrhizobium liaoningense]MBR1070782.1 phage portal protein [Bradyrhizobium liaoningense]MCP1777879.1 lambda family phage portal protein [Bradyrhizobium japonicum]MCP1959123.1 lambda family phage portal protein [Bradyrhizobium japonicum]
MSAKAPNIIKRTARAFRAFARSFSGYDITGGSGRWPQNYMLNSPVTQSLAAARLASRKIAHQAENNALISSIVTNTATAIVGDGPTVRSAHPDAEVNAQLQRVWNAFFARCDIEGTMGLGGYLCRVARGFVIDGESFTKFVVDPDAMTLSLQLLSADQVDSARTVPSLGMTGDAPNIVAGVEFDAIGRRVAYWVLPTQPDAPWASVLPPVRVAALDVCHVYEPRFPGMPRGISPLTAVAPLAMQLDEAVDASIVKLKTTALLSMLIRDPEGELSYDFDSTNNPQALHLEPGATLRLPPGADVSFPPVSEMNTLGEVLAHIERLICAGSGTGVPFFIATGDLGSVNFSAGKLGMAAFQRRVKALQANHFVAQLLTPIWDRIVLLEVLSGRLRAPDFESNPERYTAQFLFTGWPPIDELKAAKAATLNIAAKVKSRAEVISEGGRDPADVDAEIEADPFAADDLSASATTINGQPDTENA